MKAGDSAVPSATEILLCGASVRSLAAAALDVGLRPTCVDFFADHDLQLLLASNHGTMARLISHFAELPLILRDVPAGIPLIWAGGLENHPDVLDLLSAKHPLFGAESDVVRLVRDPIRLGTRLRDEGFLFPVTVRSETEYAQLAPKLPSTQWIRKPLQSGGGINVSLFAPTRQETQLPNASYLQQYIRGIPMSALYLAADDGTDNNSAELLGCSLQLTGWSSLHADNFQYAGSLGPVSLPQPLINEVQRAGQTIASWSNLRGVFGIDFVLKQGRPWFLEVNPRITASHELFELTTRRHLIREHMACFGYSAETTNRTCDSTATRRIHQTQAVLRAPFTNGLTQPAQMLRMIVYSPRTCVSDEVFGAFYQGNPARWPLSIRQIPRDHSAPPFGDTPRILLADIPSVGQTIESGSPLCSIYVRGGDVREILDTVREVTSGSGGAEHGQAAEFLSSLHLSGQTLVDSLNALETSFLAHLRSAGTPEFL